MTVLNKSRDTSKSVILSQVNFGYSLSGIIVIDNFQYTRLKNESLFEEFERLKNLWLEETKYTSIPSQIYGNNYYKRIIKMGEEVLPFIILDLKQNYNNWFFALQEITKTNAIKNEHIGDFKAMANDWIEWSEK